MNQNKNIRINMNHADLIGLAAGVFTSSGFIPQLFKIFKTKSVKDISTPTLVIIIIGVTLWLIYGLLTKDLPVVAANVVTFITVALVLILKFVYR